MHNSRFTNVWQVVAAKWALYSMVASHRWRTALSWWWGLWAPRILQIPHFRNPKGSRLLRVPQFGPHNPAMGVLKSPGDPVQSVCSEGILAVPLLASILRSWHQGSWNCKRLVYLRHQRHLWLFSHLRATSVVMGPLTTVPQRDHFLSPVPNGWGSYKRGSRSTLIYRLEHFQLKCIINLGTWSQQCPR